jgi:hypothetical protein
MGPVTFGWPGPTPREHSCRDVLAEGCRMGHCACAVSWGVFIEQQPGLASQGGSLLYQHGVGLGFLATVRRDGRPRVHPMCPLISDDGLFAFIVPSPKQFGLKRRGAYALHSFPSPTNEDAFYVTGRAELVSDNGRRAALAAQFVAERASIGVALPSDDDALFEFDIDSCLLTRTTGHGDPAPDHHVWHAVDLG